MRNWVRLAYALGGPSLVVEEGLYRLTHDTWFRHPLSLRFETGKSMLFRVHADHKPVIRARVGATVYWNFDEGWHAHATRFTGIEVYYGRVRRWYGLRDSN